MATIDTSKIEGFSTMTAEQKLAALEAYEVPEPDYSGYVKKETFDKTASELAKVKKKLSDSLTDEEKRKQEAEEELNTLREQVKQMSRTATINEHKSSFVALGYDEKLAVETATALADGDVKKVLENQKVFLTEHDKAYKAELLKGNKTPPAGGGDNTHDYEKMAQDAMAAGSFAEAARYTRLAGEQKA